MSALSTWSTNYLFRKPAAEQPDDDKKNESTKNTSTNKLASGKLAKNISSPKPSPVKTTQNISSEKPAPVKTQNISSQELAQVKLAKRISPYNFAPVKVDVQTGGPAGPEAADKFIKSSFVHGLKWDNFADFVNNKDVVLVMFYNTSDKNCFLCKPRFIQAAQSTSRDNHAYAAVNCRTEKALCSKHNITSMPTFKMFSRGYPFSTVKDFHLFDSDIMKKFVETSPV